MNENLESYPPISAPLAGAWRLTSVMDYEGAYRGWCVPTQDHWGPKIYVFEGDVLTIHTPDEAESMHYVYSPEKRCIVLGEEKYFIRELSDSELVLDLYKRAYNFVRIDEKEIREKEVGCSLLPQDLSGLWQVISEYSLIDGEWQQSTDYGLDAGIYFWKVIKLPQWGEYRFGRSPLNHGLSSYSFNERCFIIRQYESRQKDRFLHPTKAEEGWWVYVLDSMTGDYRDSRQKLHLVPVDRSKKDLFVESLLWAESERHHNTAAEKIPMDLLRLWASANPDQTADLISSNELIDSAQNYRSEAFAGAYVFLHYYAISMKVYDEDSMASAYRTFHEVISRWVMLYDEGKTVKYIYPFNFKKNPDHLAKLRQAEESEFGPSVKHRAVNRELLRKRLAEIRSTDHYLYALMDGLPKDIFYIQREVDVPDGDGRGGNVFTLQEFLMDTQMIQPDDPLSLNLFLSLGDTERNIYVCDWILFSEGIDRLCEFSTENINRLFDAFLTAYCEKCLRQNTMFCLSPDTIRHFGFTEDDVRELDPRLDRLNTEAKNRIRKDYQALAQLDFIRAERDER